MAIINNLTSGCIGPQGFSGPTGSTGATGPIGFGSTGPTGIMGPTGRTGPRGYTGANGADGQMGLMGYTGPAGPAGTPGATGPIGCNGPTGPQGLTGPQGPPGEGATNSILNYTFVNNTDYEITESDDVISVYTEFGNTINLDLPYSIEGKTYIIKNVGSGDLAIRAFFSIGESIQETIDGANEFVLGPASLLNNSSCTLVGTNKRNNPALVAQPNWIIA